MLKKYTYRLFMVMLKQAMASQLVVMKIFIKKKNKTIKRKKKDIAKRIAKYATINSSVLVQ